jgi:hypothetical protein
MQPYSELHAGQVRLLAASPKPKLHRLHFITGVAMLSQKQVLQSEIKLVQGVQKLLLVELSSMPWSQERHLVESQRVQWGKVNAQGLHLLSEESKKYPSMQLVQTVKDVHS